MKVLMVVMTDVAHDARVLREAETLVDAGHQVDVIGKDVPPGWSPPAGIRTISVRPVSVFGAAGRGSTTTGQEDAGATRPGTRRPRNPLARAARWVLLPRHRLSVRASWTAQAARAAGDGPYDVVHAHDFSALPLGDALARRYRARLVYDSHEWWGGRARYGRPTPWERAQERRAETRLLAAADTVITVSDGIARRLEAMGAREVTVVRNTFSMSAGPPADRGVRPVLGVVYAGRIDAGRDLPAVLGAMDRTPTLRVSLIGPVDQSFASRLGLAGSQAAGSHGGGGRVRILPARPVDEVDEVLREEGIAVVTLTDSCENHRLALPNKLFHAVRAGVPVVAADLPEIRSVVRQYRIGVLYRPGSAASLAAALHEVLADYESYRQAVRVAAAELCWAVDGARLVEVYQRLADPTRTRRSLP
ncbi:MAG: glycosyltransferase [Actinomycetes bacterium]